LYRVPRPQSLTHESVRSTLESVQGNLQVRRPPSPFIFLAEGTNISFATSTLRPCDDNDQPGQTRNHIRPSSLYLETTTRVMCGRGSRVSYPARIQALLSAQKVRSRTVVMAKSFRPTSHFPNPRWSQGPLEVARPQTSDDSSSQPGLGNLSERPRLRETRIG
jgi:hypothetical protein